MTWQNEKYFFAVEVGLFTCLIFISKKFMALNGSGEFIATFQCSQNDIQFNSSGKRFNSTQLFPCLL